jgi:hypothetical protein
MTIDELKQDLSEALRSLDRADVVAAKRVEQWAAALERSDSPDPESQLFSATQLRTRAAKGSMARLKTEIVIVLTKLHHWGAAG